MAFFGKGLSIRTQIIKIGFERTETTIRSMLVTCRFPFEYRSSKLKYNKLAFLKKKPGEV